MRFLALAIACILALPPIAGALSPEEIATMVEKKATAFSPYQSLLNDPDPAKSREAMRIMMESGEEDLVRMAMEYGLTSPDLDVRRLAFEAYLKTAPLMRIEIEEKHGPAEVRHFIESQYKGTMDIDGTGRALLGRPSYNQNENCFNLGAQYAVFGCSTMISWSISNKLSVVVRSTLTMASSAV